MNVPLNMNGKKITGILLDKSNVPSAATVEYVNYKTKIYNTLKYDYREFFYEIIDFTNASTYELSQGSSGVIINYLGGKIQINNKVLNLQHISADGLNCKFISEASPSSQYLKLITGDQITNQFSFTLALVVKLGDISQRFINNFALREPDGANTGHFIACVAAGPRTRQNRLYSPSAN